MIIDYDFRGKRVTIVGGGHETARKVRSFVEAQARVQLLGPSFDAEATRVARELRVPIVGCPASQVLRRAFESADAVVVVADDRDMGRTLRPVATRKRVLFYAGDDPEVSDWVQPAVRFAGPIAVAVSTGGESPIIARSLADRLVRRVRARDRLEVRVQSYARILARRRIPSPADRRRVLHAIHEDEDVQSALASGDLTRAKGRARRLVLQAVSRGPTLRAARTTRAP